MSKTPSRKRSSRRWLYWTAGGLLGGLAIAAALVSIALHRAEPILRARIVAALEEHFHARVELDGFHVSLMDGLRAEGKGLRIWPPSPAGAASGTGAPLIQLSEFRFHAPLRFQPGQPIHIPVIALKGLNIDIPPHTRFAHPAAASNPAPATVPGAGLISFQIGRIECTGARLTLETSKPGKLPLVFDIAHLKVENVSTHAPMRFSAELTNPRPVGTITTTGQLGPWPVADPGELPLQGDYTFAHANLSNFHGIAGTLHSTGHYQGTLRNLAVDGTTDTPDFRLTQFGTPLRLHTRFHARVDGTDGDTWLEPVDAVLGQSHFTAQGSIVRRPPSPAHPKSGAPASAGGHDILLNVNVDHGRAEDFLRLTSRSGAPLLTGTLTMKTALEIPPGPAPVHRRLLLHGSFLLDQAQFTSDKIQNRIAELSLRGQGRPGDAHSNPPGRVRSSMQGDFNLSGGVLALPSLHYSVPGAQIDLKGNYTLENGVMDFTGTARMQATVSKMVGGWKGLLLKPADRFFRKDGAGTEVPIHIRGTREEPDFGIDFGHLGSTRPQRPDQPQQ